MDWKYAFLVMLGLCGVFVAIAFLSRPVKWLVKLAGYAVVGTALILVANIILGQMGMRIALNPATIFTAGVLQIPGTVLLVILNYFFV